MAGQLDVLTDSEARQAIGLEGTDVSQDALLGLYSGLTSTWLDDTCREPVVSRQVASLAATTTGTVLPITASDTEWWELGDARRRYRTVTIGTDADHVRVAAYRRIVGLDQDAGTITISGPDVDAADTDGIRLGSYASTETVPADLKVCAMALLEWAWGISRGVARSTFDELPLPANIPYRIWEMIPDRIAPGIV